MIQRIAFSMSALALAMFVGTASAADKPAKRDAHSHTGTVVSAGQGKLVMTGKNGKEHAHDVAATAKVMVDGKPAKLEDLKKGTMVSVTIDKDKKVTEITSGKPTSETKAHATPVKPAAKATAAKTTPAKASAAKAPVAKTSK